jgi:hypothetical protein
VTSGPPGWVSVAVSPHVHDYCTLACAIVTCPPAPRARAIASATPPPPSVSVSTWSSVPVSGSFQTNLSQSYIAKRFPAFQIEEGFAEEDPLWTADYRETDESMQVRSRNALDRIFDEQTGAKEICEWREPFAVRQAGARSGVVRWWSYGKL